MRVQRLVIPVAVAVALLCGFVAAVHPLIFTGHSEPCFPMDTPASEVCFGTRCSHLFNVSAKGVMMPTPQTKYPQTYPVFGCNVSVHYEYKGYRQRPCLRPLCYCKKHYSGGKCNPTTLTGCSKHQCIFSRSNKL